MSYSRIVIFMFKTRLKWLNHTSVPCVPGTFGLGGNNKCSMCPIGEFQYRFSSSRCIKCLNNIPTYQMGSINEMQCVDAGSKS